ncbi:polysaccharide deacetylase family protein [Tatumella citrea]|uniref:Polysaccharide deacetylase n=1 Tax=Tatumella citrea TaxID=53336 RepID=A0A1Y0LLL8_TATCI|nr:polysaccharide deacetylase [Tatumella citrea]ARU94470.1 polysaccharide deacetylase [Tatumella citrea]ARU98509.1 polysaccharide deacetylase [Tatumella citrea]
MTESSRWPSGYQSAALISIDFNDIHGILTQAPAVAGRDKTLSVWRYGTLRGVERLLALLAESEVQASWCLPAIVAEEQPELARQIVANGHEIACSGDRHEDFSLLSLQQQIDSVKRGCEKLSAITGQAVKGFRTPAGQWKPGLASALTELGICWSSSWRGDDLPYFHPGTRLVELPMHYTLEDEPYFAFNLSPAIPPGQSRIAPYGETLANLSQDFEAFHRFGLCYLLRLHPEITGTAGRIGIVRSLLQLLKKNSVWIATAGQIANHWQTQPDNDPYHPVEVFHCVSGDIHA